MGNCQSAFCAPDPWLAPDTTTQEVVAGAKTGDIIMSSGQGLDGRIIGKTSITGWASHVMIVIRNPDDPNSPPMITEEYPTVVGRELRPGLPPYHTGAQLVDLKERLDTYSSGRLAWRPLYIKEESTYSRRGQYDKLRRLTVEEERVLYRTFMGRLGSEMPEYNLSLKDFWQYGTRNDPIDDDNDGKYVCTSWGTMVLSSQRGMGILAETLIDADGQVTPVVPGNILLADMAGYGDLPLRSKYAYGDLHFFKGAQRPGNYPEPTASAVASSSSRFSQGVVVGVSRSSPTGAPPVFRVTRE